MFINDYAVIHESLVPQMVKNLVAMHDSGSIPGWGTSPGGVMAIPSSILAWEILWSEEPGVAQSQT